MIDLRREPAAAIDKVDKELVEESLAGSQDSFRCLYTRYVAKVQSTIVRLSGPTHLNDKTQEVFLRQSLQQLLLSEDQKLLTARANTHYAFDLVDEPNADTIPSGTRPVMIILAGLFAGMGFAVIWLFFQLRQRLSADPDGYPLAQPLTGPVLTLSKKLLGR